MIVDAVGVTETDLADTQPLDRKPTVPLERLLKQLSFGNRDPDVRLDDRRPARPARPPADEATTARSSKSSPAATLSDLTHGASSTRSTPTASSTPRALRPARSTRARRRSPHAASSLLDAAVEPLATNPAAAGAARRGPPVLRADDRRDLEGRGDRGRLLAGRRRPGAQDRRVLPSSSSSEHKDEITALQILYSRPYQQRLTFTEIKELADAIGRPPYQWTPEKLWEAYEALDRSKVRGSGGRVLTDLVSLVRFALQQDDELVPYPELVRERFQAWLLQQENAGATFTAEQLAWLERIRDHVAASLGITADDFDYTPFVEQGGLGKAYELFGEELSPLLDELNEALAA